MKPKLLIIELWGLGDLVIATPFIRAAAEKYAVTLLAKPFAVDLGRRLWPNVQVIPFTAPWTAFRFFSKYNLWRWPWRQMRGLQRTLRSAQFDYGVSARWDPRDHFLLKAIGARERIGFPRLNSRRYLTQSLVRSNPLAHRSENWRVVGAALGLAVPSRTEMVPTPRDAPPILLIHTGARVPLRVWPLLHFRDIAGRLRRANYQVKIACDGNQLAWWRAQGEEAVCPHTVNELLECLDQASVFLGNDSGPGHLAASCGLPTFTLFGPQLYELFAPMHPAAEWIEGKACPYKPCSDYCRFPTPYCLQDISPDDVWARVREFARRHLGGEQRHFE